MHDRIQERCIRIGQYIADTGATVRGAARHFGVSKSSVHKDMDERLPKINQTLYRQVRRVLSYNKSVRHLRGGEATVGNTFTADRVFPRKQDLPFSLANR